ncbi:MAG: hypothetical protein U5L06_06955 [Rhodovibrio sp.]|nr:hypothetical protein [Rhodovibrio sp.]
MLESLASQDFEPYLNQTFTLSTAEESFEAELVEVAETARPRGGRERDGVPRSFTLTFAAPPGTRAGQQTFAVSHAEMGTLELFVVPHGPQDDGRMTYLAVLN